MSHDHDDGPSCVRVPMGTGYALLLKGGRDYEVEINGEVILFEDHPYCGPMPLIRSGAKRGQERVLGPRHRFWKVMEWWYQQGKQLDEHGRCVYREVSKLEETIGPDHELVHLGGRHYYIVPKGTDHEAFKAELLRKARE